MHLYSFIPPVPTLCIYYVLILASAVQWQDYRDDLVGKVFVICVWEPKLLLSIHTERQAWWSMFVIPVLRRGRQADLWGLLASQSSLVSKLQANEETLSQKAK